MPRLFLLFFIFLTSCQSSFYIVRHAEKGTQPANNPPLTEAGSQRAEDLKKILLDKKITDIYSTQTLRTESTAKPLADAINVSVQSYDARNQTAFIEKLKQMKKKNVLIVGHSNTIRHIINGLYEKDTIKKDLEDAEYNNLFIVKRKFFPVQKKTFTRLTYGK